MTDSYGEFDKPYRRGLILGLSLAELFLILIFLLLLVAIGAVQFLEEEKLVLEEEKEELHDQLIAIYEQVGDEITVEVFGEFIERTSDYQKTLDKIESLEKEREKLRDELVKKEEEIEKAEKEVEKAEKEAEKAEKEVEETKSELAEANEENEKKEQVIGGYEKAGRGQNPPCWYVEVPDGDGGLRQKHVKIFDVIIKDYSFKVTWNDISKNYTEAEVRKGDETALPYVNPAFFNRDLREDKFTAIFSDFREVADKKLIHDYKCRFMVNVRDQTSKDNKDGYKHNLSVVESIFYKHEERGL